MRLTLAVVRRIMTVTLLQPSIGMTLMELLTFNGNEMYVNPIPPQLVGRTFEEAGVSLITRRLNAVRVCVKLYDVCITIVVYFSMRELAG